MSLQRFVKKLVVLAATGVALALSAALGYADGCGNTGNCGSCGNTGACAVGGCCSQDGCCAKGCCPAPLVHCTPKPPVIKFKCVCGKPVCNPCDLQGYGYNPTCWRPWLPPLSCPNSPVPSLNCSVAPALAAPTPYPQSAPPTGHNDQLPTPQRFPDDK